MKNPALSAIATLDTVTRCSQLLRKNADDADIWHAIGTELAASGDRVRAFTRGRARSRSLIPQAVHQFH